MSMLTFMIIRDQGSIMLSSKLLYNDEGTHACNVYPHYQSVGEEAGEQKCAC